MVMEDVSEIFGKGDWTSCSQLVRTFRASGVGGIHSYVTSQDFSTDHDCPEVPDGQAW